MEDEAGGREERTGRWFPLLSLGSLSSFDGKYYSQLYPTTIPSRARWRAECQRATARRTSSPNLSIHAMTASGLP
jgi:hypothetical protein